MAQKTWFITGASRGLGFHMAAAALRGGERVVATARKPRGLAEALGEHAGGSPTGDRLVVATLDVTDDVSTASAVEAATDAFGRIDVLVNNAGFGQMGFFETVSPEAIQRQFDVNLFGLMSVTRRVLPVMRQQRAGHIFNIGSIGGTKGYPGWSIYCATKYALEGFSQSLAEEVKGFGIGVTVVEPGFFRTDFLDASSVARSDIENQAYTQATAAQRETFDSISHHQPGDPAKLGELLLKVSGLPQPPLHLAAGSDALEVVGDALKERERTLRQWAQLTQSTDFPS